MGSINIRRIALTASLVALFVSYAGLWIRLINNPVERTGSDFIAFYSAGRVAQKEGIAQTYEPLQQQKIQQEEVGFPLVPGQVLLYNHLPFLIPLLQIIMSTNYVASFCRWVILLIVFYILSITILSKTLEQAEIDRGSIALTAIGALLFLPVFFSLMNGQDTALLFLGAAIWVYGFLSGKEMLAGLGLSLTTVRPQLALFLALPMLFRHLKVFWGFLVGSGILGLLSTFLLGASGTREFIDVLLLSTGGEWYGMKERSMYNLIGLLTRAIPQLGPDTIRIVGWIVYITTLVGLCILWRRMQSAKQVLIGSTVTLALFLAPHLHFHDLALLLIPLYELIQRSGKVGQLKTSIATVIPIAISLLLLVSNISPHLQYTVPYLIMLVLAFYPFLPTPKIPFAVLRQS